MKRAKRESKKATNTRAKKHIGLKPGETAVEKKESLKRLVHLFQVNMVELEHQNQELRITEEELEASRSKYVNLFDFSPIPYFVLNMGGTIEEVNLSAGTMLGIERNKLIGRNLSSYIPLEDKSTFSTFIRVVFNSSVKQSCRLKMINKNKRVFHVLLEGLRSDDTLESAQRCQIALVDLTEYKKLEDSVKELSEELRLLR